MGFRALPRAFFDRDPATVARELLGNVLVRRLNGILLAGVITETEAYLPSGDAAAHGFRGRTKRNESLYKEAGHAYVHAMRHHHLVDVVTEGPDRPGSVLLRAVLPIAGVATMQKLRGRVAAHRLANGPGKLCAALSITRALDGSDMTIETNELFIAEARTSHAELITMSPRVGISHARDLPLRFSLTISDTDNVLSGTL